MGAGAAFKGVIGRYHWESKPWWPAPQTASDAPNVLFVVLDSATGKITAGPEFHARGFGDDANVDYTLVRDRIAEAFEDAAANGVADTYQLQQRVRRIVGKWVNDTYRRRPMIISFIGGSR